MIYRFIYFFFFISAVAFGQTSDSTLHSDDSLRRVVAKDVLITTNPWNGESYLSPSTVIIRSAQDLIQLSGSASLGSVLALAHPSLDVRNYGTQSGIALASFRGLPAEYTAVYRNGIRITNSQHNLADLSKSGIRFADHIEIVSGANAAMLGAAVGGVALNIVSLEPTTAYASFGSHVTSYDNISSIAEKEVFGLGVIRLSDKVSIEAGASFNKDAGDFPFLQDSSIGIVHRSNNDSYLTLINLEPTIKLSDASQIRSLFTFAQTERGVPGYVTTDRSGASAPFARQFDKDFLGGLTYETEHTKNWKTFASAAYQSQSLTYNDPLVGLHEKYENHGYSSSLRTRYSQVDRFQFILGAEFDRNTLTSNENADTSNSQIARDRIAGLLAAQYNIFADLAVTGATRIEHISDRNETRILPSVSIGYSSTYPDSKWNTDISFGKFYHPPTFNALYWKVGGNPGLISEDGSSLEASVQWRTSLMQSLNIQLQLTGFYTRLHNQIVWLPSPKGYWMPNNILESETMGIEFDGAVAWSLSNQFSLRFHQQVSLDSTTNLSEGLNKGNWLPYSVPVRTVSTLSLEKPDYGKFSVVLRYRAARFTDFANDSTSRLPSVSTLDFQYQSPRIYFIGDLPLMLECGITNISNVQYGEIRRYPLPGRAIKFGIQFTTN